MRTASRLSIPPHDADFRRTALDITAAGAISCGKIGGRPTVAPEAHEDALNESAMSMALETLLGRCADGDRAAFRQLYDRTAPQLYAVALRITRQRSLAADAVHDAFLQVWQRAGRFDPARGGAETWLLSLARYRALDLIRRQGREITGGEIPDQADEGPDPLARLTEHREGAALRRCLDRLELDKRQLVMMAFLDGLTHAELATRLEAPLGTVKSWIRRGLQDLRRCLEA